MIDETGYDLMPNALTQGAIQSVNITRTASPFGSECISSWDNTNYTSYVHESWTYSLMQCQRVCTHSSVVQDCGCFHPLFLDQDAAELRPCNLTSGCKCNACLHIISKIK